MLTIIHGEDTATSRKHFYELKQKHIDAPFFDGEKVTLTDLAQIFEGGELFSNSKTVFIEHLLVKKKKSAEKDALITVLQKYAKENDIVLWEAKELERSVVSQFKTAAITPFKLPQTLFLLVENIKPGNGKQLVSLFQKTIQTTETEMVFFMLIRQIRLLLAVVTPTNEKIDELKRMAPWQMQKLQQQAKFFQPQQLLNLYNQLFILEKGQKTGNLPTNLAISIDFLLLEI